MLSARSSETDVVRFLRRLSAVVNQGSATSPYKPLLLLALFDVVTVLPAGNNHVSFELLGDRALRILWLQVRPFAGRDLGASGATGDLGAVRLVEDVQRVAPSLARLLGRAEHRSVRSGLARDLGWLLAQWPVPRLQTVGGQDTEFLYALHPEWPTRTRGPLSNKAVPRHMLNCSHGRPGLDLLPGVPELLFELAGLVRPLVELRYASLLGRAQEQAAQEADFGLLSHLFPGNARGLDRTQALLRLQGAAPLTCFWCGRAIAGAPHVDHVLPWSVYRHDSVHNLVLSDARCNRVKSDLFVSPALLRPFIDRLRAEASQAGAGELAEGVLSDLQETWTQLQVALERLPQQILGLQIEEGKPVTGLHRREEYSELLQMLVTKP